MLIRVVVSILVPIAIIAIFLALGVSEVPELLLSWPMRVLGALRLVNFSEEFYYKWGDTAAIFALATESILLFAVCTIFASRKVA